VHIPKFRNGAEKILANASTPDFFGASDIILGYALNISRIPKTQTLKEGNNVKRHIIAGLALALLVAMAMPFAAFAYDDYPSKWKDAEQDSLVDTWGMYNRECVSFVAWCLSSRNGYTINRAGRSWSAGKWKENAIAAGIPVDGTPAVGAVAWWNNIAGGIPHVAWVSAVNGDVVTVEEYNLYRGRYSQSTISKDNPAAYIHFKDVPNYRTPVIINGESLWISAQPVLEVKEYYYWEGGYDYLKFSDGLAVMRGKDGLFGYIDEDGAVTIPFQFKYATSFDGGVAHVVDQDGKSRFIDKKLNTLAKFDKTLETNEFSDGLIYAYGLGYLDKEGKVAFRFRDDYDGIEYPTFREGLARIWDRDTRSYQYMDKTGKVVISGNMDYASKFKNGLAFVHKDSVWGYMNKSGEIVETITYPDLSKYMSHQFDRKPPFVDGITIITDERSYGYANIEGKVIAEPGKYGAVSMFFDDPFSDFSEGFAAVSKNGAYGVIDKTGKEVVALTLDYVSDFNDGHAIFIVNNRIGILKISKPKQEEAASK
jgi:surface antigen